MADKKKECGIAYYAALRQMVARKKHQEERVKKARQDTNPVNMDKIWKAVGDALHKLLREAKAGKSQAECLKFLRDAGVESPTAQRVMQQVCAKKTPPTQMQ